MKTPREKFESDNEYRQLVFMFENMIHNAQFTPSELREACIFAHIRYMSMNPSPQSFILEENEKTALTALETLKRFETMDMTDPYNLLEKIDGAELEARNSVLRNKIK